LWAFDALTIARASPRVLVMPVDECGVGKLSRTAHRLDAELDRSHYGLAFSK